MPHPRRQDPSPPSHVPSAPPSLPGNPQEGLAEVPAVAGAPADDAEDLAGAHSDGLLPAQAAQAFGRIFRCHARALHRAALRVLGDSDAADDAVQVVFARMMINADTYTARDISRAYLYQAVMNEARSMLRRRSAEEPPMPGLVDCRPDPRPDPLAKAARSEARRLIEQWSLELPPRCREVVRRVIFDQMTQAEAAAEMGISPKAVQKQMHRARALMQARAPVLRRNRGRVGEGVHDRGRGGARIHALIEKERAAVPRPPRYGWQPAGNKECGPRFRTRNPATTCTHFAQPSWIVAWPR